MSHDARVLFKDQLAARLVQFYNSCHNAVDGRFCEEHGVYHGDEESPTSYDLYLKGRSKKKKV